MSEFMNDLISIMLKSVVELNRMIASCAVMFEVLHTFLPLIFKLRGHLSSLLMAKAHYEGVDDIRGIPKSNTNSRARHGNLSILLLLESLEL